jgi:hypothetical protein
MRQLAARKTEATEKTKRVKLIAKAKVAREKTKQLRLRIQLEKLRQGRSVGEDANETSDCESNYTSEDSVNDEDFSEDERPSDDPSVWFEDFKAKFIVGEKGSALVCKELKKAFLKWAVGEGKEVSTKDKVCKALFDSSLGERFDNQWPAKPGGWKGGHLTGWKNMKLLPTH